MTPTPYLIMTAVFVCGWILACTTIRAAQTPTQTTTATPATEEPEVTLPTSTAELDAFTEDLITDFGLPRDRNTFNAVAVMIIHLPASKAHAKRSYFAHSVLKQLANDAAFERHAQYKKEWDAEEKAKEAAKTPNLTVVPETTTVDGLTVQNT